MGTFADKIIDFNTHLNYEDALPEGFAVLNPYVDNPEAVRVMELFYRKFYNDNHKRYFIIANINRNILLSDIPLYSNVLADEGILLLSGFYESDMPAIVEKAKECGLSFVENIERNNWVAVKLKKTK